MPPVTPMPPHPGPFPEGEGVVFFSLLPPKEGRDDGSMGMESRTSHPSLPSSVRRTRLASPRPINPSRLTNFRKHTSPAF